MVWYWEKHNLEYVVRSDGISQTMLTEFFHLNSTCEKSRAFLYREIPKHFVWNKQTKRWTARKAKEVIGRVNAANPSKGECSTKEFDDEYSIVTLSEDYNAVATLNAEQKNAYDMIMERVLSNKPDIFFIDCPGGTGKTYLYRAILAKVRSQKKIALATASLGVTSSILPGGRTAHSRFKIPILANESVVCKISKQSSIVESMRKTSVIIWDEAPMAKRYAIEAVDRTLQDLLSTTEPFGGKVAVFGGDFRQVLPVVPRGTRTETIGVSFADFLLRVGNGEEPILVDNMIKLPDEMVIKSTNEEDLEKELINAVFPHLLENAHSAEYITN
ncbi:uncharacterized protein LOC132272752 [Cornus florida]|uniref:uncharacterized protein LOC132272752 n=1 Tax=Cornus florida TaxID=4283 RepID=UPI00289EC658|nr:uncharacterized protein LOC132272752 [Cornus florida]